MSAKTQKFSWRGYRPNATWFWWNSYIVCILWIPNLFVYIMWLLKLLTHEIIVCQLALTMTWLLKCKTPKGTIMAVSWPKWPLFPKSRWIFFFFPYLVNIKLLMVCFVYGEANTFYAEWQTTMVVYISRTGAWACWKNSTLYKLYN